MIQMKPREQQHSSQTSIKEVSLSQTLFKALLIEATLSDLLVWNFQVAFCFLSGSCQVLLLSNHSEFQATHLHVLILCFSSRDWEAPVPHLNTATITTIFDTTWYQITSFSLLRVVGGWIHDAWVFI